MTDSTISHLRTAWFGAGVVATITVAAAVTAWDLNDVTARLRAAAIRAAMSPTQRADHDRVIADLEAEQARLTAERNDRTEHWRTATGHRFRPDLLLTSALKVADLSVTTLTDELTHAYHQLDEAYDRWVTQDMTPEDEAECTMWRGHVDALHQEVANRRFDWTGYARLSHADQLRLDIAYERQNARIGEQLSRIEADPAI